MNVARIGRWAIVAVVMLWVNACATTMTTGTWKDKSYTGKIHEVLVIGLASSDANRRIFEDTLAKAFEKAGKKGIASNGLLPDTKKISKETVAPIVKEEGIDAVIVARVVSVNKEQRYVPNSYPSSYNTFYGYYDRVGPYYYEPGYYVQDTIVALEINLYDAKTGKIVWAITTETISPDNVNKEIDKLASIIIGDLTKQGLM
ncbi:MAG: hypothetical protein ACC707_03925 [Thiohalomonadales bacterium]